MYDVGKGDYLRPSEHIGLDWILKVGHCPSKRKLANNWSVLWEPVNSSHGEFVTCDEFTFR